MSSKHSMTSPSGSVGALRSEHQRIESDGKFVRVLLICLALVLAFGAITFLLPRSVWSRSPLVLTISPEILFMALLVLILLALYLVRYESEARKLRLLTLQQALAAQADHTAKAFDAVTNVFTRNFLQGLLEKEISRSERNGRPLGLMMCDLNNFKRVNDRYGHLMGDEILAQVAAILKSCLRGSDHVVRYGGDEFLMILPDTDEPGAAIVRARILQRMAEWDAANRLGDVPVSLSLGLYHHAPGQSVDQDLSEVDARMYAEKRTG
ncbi:MAG TPA: GGDEF domain-containing protein [Terriglobia bacterium]|nr:GGDEF domain-containing protein [Terriglobia bacterium]